jgi:hypothetical protein
MNSKSLGLIILALIIVVGGYFGYKRFATPAAAPAAPAAAAAGAMPDAVKSAYDTAMGAIPGITPEQKTKLSECISKAVGAMKPEDVTKLATDKTAMMAPLATCATAAGLKMPG